MSLVGLAIMSCKARVFALMLLYAIRLAQIAGRNRWVSSNVMPGTGISFYVIISINPYSAKKKMHLKMSSAEIVCCK